MTDGGVVALAQSGTAPGTTQFDQWDLRTRLRERPADLLDLQPGRPVELSGPPGFGLTRLGYGMLSEVSRQAPVAILDVRGWASPAAAWEAGVDRMVVVRCGDARLWPRVLAALVDGVPAVYAEVPTGVRDADLRRISALARNRQSRLVLRPLRGALTAGVSHLRIRAEQVVWSGTDAGHGRLGHRRLVLEASGKATGGISRTVQVDDTGRHEGLRVLDGSASMQVTG